MATSTTPSLPLIGFSGPHSHIHSSPSRSKTTSYPEHSYRIILQVTAIRILNAKPCSKRYTSAFCLFRINSDHHQRSHQLHYAAIRLAPLPVVSTHEALEDKAECPVCLELLSFSFTLHGEKPHIVPECGHAYKRAVSDVSFGTPRSEPAALKLQQRQQQRSPSKSRRRLPDWIYIKPIQRCPLLREPTE